MQIDMLVGLVHLTGSKQQHKINLNVFNRKY